MNVRRFIKKRQRLFLFSKPRFLFIYFFLVCVWGGGLKSMGQERDKGDMAEMKGDVIYDVKGVY